MQEYEEFRRWLVKKLHHQLGREFGAELQRQGMTEEQLIDDMEEDRKTVHDQLYGPNS
jgi:hypothetical protein